MKALFVLIQAVTCASVLSFFQLAQADAWLFSNLTINLSTSVETAESGDTVTFSALVENGAELGIVISNPVAVVKLPLGSANIVSTDCIQSAPLTLECALAELGPQQSANIAISATLNNEGHNLVEASITADGYSLVDARTDAKILTVSAGETSAANNQPVDLSIDLEIPPGNFEVHSPICVTVTSTNQNSTVSAIAPEIEILLPDSYEFSSSDICTSDGQMVFCKVGTLAPGAEIENQFMVTAKVADTDATIFATVSSTQPEEMPADNETQLLTTIDPFTPFEVLCGASNPECFGGTPTEPDADSNTDIVSEPDAETDTDLIIPNAELEPVAAAAESGGGSVFSSLLLVILGLVYLRRIGMLRAERGAVIKHCPLERS